MATIRQILSEQYQIDPIRYSHLLALLIPSYLQLTDKECRYIANDKHNSNSGFSKYIERKQRNYNAYALNLQKGKSK